MKRKRGTGLNVGAASILVIFVLLCLTTFATLSLLTARADYNLTVKTAETAQSYYRADRIAEEMLLELDDLLMMCYEGADEPEYFMMLCQDIIPEEMRIQPLERDGDVLWVRYQVPLNQTQELAVELAVTYNPGGKRFTRAVWQTRTVGDWLPVESMGVWTGDDSELLF